MTPTLRCPSCESLAAEHTHYRDLYCRACGLCAPEPVFEQLAARIRFLQQDRDELLETLRALRRALDADACIDLGDLVELVRTRCRREEVAP